MDLLRDTKSTSKSVAFPGEKLHSLGLDKVEI